MRAYVIGDDNIVRREATGVVLINCNGYEATEDVRDKTVFANGGFVIDSNGIGTGTISVTRKTQTASFIAGVDAYNVYIVDATGGNIDVTLEADNMPVWFVRKDGTANTVTITPNTGGTINGAGSYGLNIQYEKIHVISDGTDFYF